MKHTFTLNNAVLAVLQFIFGAALMGACGSAIALFSTTSVTFNRLYSFECADFNKLNVAFLIIFAACTVVAVCDNYLKKQLTNE